MVAELQPAPLAKRSEIVREPTGSPVRRCSLMIAERTAWPRASGVQSDCVCDVEARIAITYRAASGASKGYAHTPWARERDGTKTISKLFSAAARACQELNSLRPGASLRAPRRRPESEYSGLGKTRANERPLVSASLVLARPAPLIQRTD